MKRSCAGSVISRVDDFSRECLVLEVDTSITGKRVVAALERLADLRGLPLSITVDHGPEFEGHVFDAWACQRPVLYLLHNPSGASYCELRD